MRTMEIKHQVFKVSDFLAWQREGTLELSPSFQRRPVWRTSAKSFLIDTIVRNLPVPVIFVRERIDLESQRTRREVVDGQQRLRTIIAFIDPTALRDYDADRDPFLVSRRHNPEVAGREFGDLSNEIKRRILGYEFSTHVLPSTTEDRDVLTIFARMNSTGVQLNGQELRNADYFGPFKSDMYDLALEQLDRWRGWRLFSEEQIARMGEVELTSDLVMTMLNGITGKTQGRITAIYKRFDQDFPNSDEVKFRFRRIMDLIEEVLGEQISRTVYSSEVYFYTLFTFLYDLVYKLESPLSSGRMTRKVNQNTVRSALLQASGNFRSGKVPEEVRDAVIRASSDTGRRRTRHEYLETIYGAASR